MFIFDDRFFPSLKILGKILNILQFVLRKVLRDLVYKCENLRKVET